MLPPRSSRVSQLMTACPKGVKGVKAALDPIRLMGLDWRHHFRLTGLARWRRRHEMSAVRGGGPF